MKPNALSTVGNSPQDFCLVSKNNMVSPRMFWRCWKAIKTTQHDFYEKQKVNLKDDHIVSVSKNQSTLNHVKSMGAWVRLLLWDERVNCNVNDWTMKQNISFQINHPLEIIPLHKGAYVQLSERIKNLQRLQWNNMANQEKLALSHQQQRLQHSCCKQHNCKSFLTTARKLAGTK